MKSIQELRNERQAKAKEARNILDGDHWDAKTGPEKLKPLYDRIEEIDGQIEAIQKQIDIEAGNNPQDAIDRRADRDRTPKSEAEKALEMERGIFTTWARGGPNALNDDQRSHLQARLRRLQAEQAVGTDSAGGYLAPSEFNATFLELLKSFGGMREVADNIQTDHGRPLEWPTSDDTTEEGEIIAENQPASDDDIKFGIVNIGAFKYSSKVITVPFELLQDSRIDLVGHINGRLGRRIFRIENKHHTFGDGNNKPKGIVTAAGLGKTGASGQVTSVTYEDFVDLEHSIDPAYRQAGCRWMFHDTTLKVLKKLKDGDDRPLWRPGVSGADANDILNYPYTINQDMPVMAASAKSIVFGQLKKYLIRDVMAVTLFRFTDSAYTKKGQVGFLAWSRSDGDLIDAVDAAGLVQSVKHYANAAS